MLRAAICCGMAIRLSGMAARPCSFRSWARWREASTGSGTKRTACRVTVWRARVGEEGAFEPLDVQPEGGRRMAYDAWLRGLR